MYTKFLGLTLIDAINSSGISKEKRDEIVQDYGDGTKIQNIKVWER